MSLSSFMRSSSCRARNSFSTLLPRSLSEPTTSPATPPAASRRSSSSSHRIWISRFIKFPRYVSLSNLSLARSFLESSRRVSFSFSSLSARRLDDRSRSRPRSSDRSSDVLRGRPSQRKPKQPFQLVYSPPGRSRRTRWREGRSSCWSRRRWFVVDARRKGDGSSSSFGFGQSIWDSGRRGGREEIWVRGWVDDGGSFVKSSEWKRRSTAATEAFAGWSYDWRGS